MPTGQQQLLLIKSSLRSTDCIFEYCRYLQANSARTCSRLTSWPLRKTTHTSRPYRSGAPQSSSTSWLNTWS